MVWICLWFYIFFLILTAWRTCHKIHEIYLFMGGFMFWQLDSVPPKTLLSRITCTCHEIMEHTSIIGSDRSKEQFYYFLSILCSIWPSFSQAIHQASDKTFFLKITCIINQSLYKFSNNIPNSLHVISFCFIPLHNVGKLQSEIFLRFQKRLSYTNGKELFFHVSLQNRYVGGIRYNRPASLRMILKHSTHIRSAILIQLPVINLAILTQSFDIVAVILTETSCLVVEILIQLPGINAAIPTQWPRIDV